MLGAPLLFAIELTILYAAGYYAIGRLTRISGFGGSGSVQRRMAFYLLVFPGVVFHESAHYLACVLTRTKVFRFAPFSLRTSADSRPVLGYVRHERRAIPLEVIIGLAPIVFNPLWLVLGTALLTPLTFQEVANPSVGVLKEEILTSGFLTATPLLGFGWTYLTLSFALGSVPSREDLSSLPIMLLIFGGGIFFIGFFRVGSHNVLSSAIYDMSTLAAGLYALPATVAAVAALTIGLWERTSRY